MEHWAYSHWLWKYSLRLNVSSLHLLFEEALLAISFYTSALRVLVYGNNGLLPLRLML